MQNQPMEWKRYGVWSLVFLFVVLSGWAKEVDYPSDAFAKLDTFEGLNLEDADKLYAKEDYKGAYAAYKAYSFEFAKSAALPYVLLRMGRCLHQLDKRNTAIKAYQDVVDYFPNRVRYAAAALYYIGQCHAQNGDEAKQIATWAKLAKDDDYVAQPLSGTALAYLGEVMEKRGKFQEAVDYQWRTAEAFLKSNPNAAKKARESVIWHYVVRQPNHEKLVKFYQVANGFEGRGRGVDKPEEEPRYWSQVLSTALRAKTKAEQREQACAYWGAKYGNRFADNDDMHKLWCDVQMVHEKDRKRWLAKMQQQFEKQSATVDRVLQWCRYYDFNADQQAAFFKREIEPFLGGMKTEEKIKLASQLRHRLRMHKQVPEVLRTINTSGMSDDELLKFTGLAEHYETEETMLRYFAKLKDKLRAAKARFDYYNKRTHRNNPNREKALAEIPALEKSTTYAGEGLTWAKASLLKGLGRYEEAIKAFRAANREPQGTWEIVDCLVALKRYPDAIKLLRELEGVGGKTASQASMRMADVHRAAGDKAREVDQLRMVLKRYPKSGESSQAHNRLENYGVALTGGESEAKD